MGRGSNRQVCLQFKLYLSLLKSKSPSHLIAALGLYLLAHCAEDEKREAQKVLSDFVLHHVPAEETSSIKSAKARFQYLLDYSFSTISSSYRPERKMGDRLLQFGRSLAQLPAPWDELREPLFEMSFGSDSGPQADLIQGILLQAWGEDELLQWEIRKANRLVESIRNLLNNASEGRNNVTWQIFRLHSRLAQPSVHKLLQDIAQKPESLVRRESYFHFLILLARSPDPNFRALAQKMVKADLQGSGLVTKVTPCNPRNDYDRYPMQDFLLPSERSLQAQLAQAIKGDVSLRGLFRQQLRQLDASLLHGSSSFDSQAQMGLMSARMAMDRCKEEHNSSGDDRINEMIHSLHVFLRFPFDRGVQTFIRENFDLALRCRDSRILGAFIFSAWQSLDSKMRPFFKDKLQSYFLSKLKSEGEFNEAINKQFKHHNLMERAVQDANQLLRNLQEVKKKTELAARPKTKIEMEWFLENQSKLAETKERYDSIRRCERSALESTAIPLQ